MLTQAFGVCTGHRQGLSLFVHTPIEHGRSHRTRCGNEALYLLWCPVVSVKPSGQIVHMCVGAAGKTAHEVGYDILFATRQTAFFLKYLQKLLKNLHGRLAH